MQHQQRGAAAAAVNSAGNKRVQLEEERIRSVQRRKELAVVYQAAKIALEQVNTGNQIHYGARL